MIKVALVEDNEELRHLIAACIDEAKDLELSGLYPDGESAVSALSRSPVEVVLMDIHLPGISGIECVGRLKKTHPEMQFIMCTIFQDDENVFKALQAGAAGYLLKSDDFNKISDSIRDIYSGGSPMNSQIARKVIESLRVPKEPEVDAILTKRENEILIKLSKGLRYKEIADALNISTDTVRKHINNIYNKLHVQSRMEAVNKLLGR